MSITEKKASVRTLVVCHVFYKLTLLGVVLIGREGVLG